MIPMIIVYVVQDIFLLNLGKSSSNFTFSCSVLLLENGDIGTSRAVLGDTDFLERVDAIVRDAVKENIHSIEGSILLSFLLPCV
jgi:hypothetical protein